MDIWVHKSHVVMLIYGIHHTSVLSLNQLNKENKSISVADPVKDIGVHMYNQLNKENKAI